LVPEKKKRRRKGGKKSQSCNVGKVVYRKKKAQVFCHQAQTAGKEKGTTHIKG